MLRVLLLLNLLFLNIYACKGGYESCKRKIIDSSTIVNQNLEIPISKRERLIFTQDITTLNKNTKIIKQNPFLSLYLVKGKKYFRYPFNFNKHHSLGVASVNKRIAIEGKIKKRQVGLNNFAIFNTPPFTPSLLITSCCSLEGMITPKGIIEKEYIKHFLNSKNSDYGDIGIRVNTKKGKVVVIASDPFMKNNQFKNGDTIVRFNGRKVTRGSSLMKKILFSKIGKAYKIQVKRNSKILNLKVVVNKRYGGGFISDTFLEQKGIYFDKNLYITKIKNKSKSYGLKVGDHLLKANGIKVKNQYYLRKNIGDFKYFSLLLFEREGFQFFVQIKDVN
ncbi:MAG: PDZ domain-containing protein [Campylobacterota bacterium]|nr:PDZ domain-containing protein [Campylobacterota bacterium]